MILDNILITDGPLTTPCWIWQRAITSKGYGAINIDGSRRDAHRVAYEQLIGPVPEGLELDHLCKIRPCCNPAHLEPVTHATNMARARFAIQTHCKFGHEFTPENTAIGKNVRGTPIRQCRACSRRRALDSIKKRKLQIH